MTHQLQLWNAKAKQYEPAQFPAGWDDADCARLLSKAWRIVREDRPTKNPKYKPPTSQGYTRSITDVQRAYLKWAQVKGLSTITAFYSHKKRVKLFTEFTGEIKYVDDDNYFAVTEEIE